MDHSTYLRELILILGIALVVVTFFHRLRIPTIAGFILAGIMIGPKGFGLVSDIQEVELLAEIGVALLLFGIGLEFSLNQLKRLWRPILIGGILQVGLTILAAVAISMLLGWTFRAALFVGFLFAVSSTAIVLRGLDSRGETGAPHGRLTLGILLFQDLCVVPMMLVLPFLGGGDASLPSMLIALLQSVIIVAGVLIAAKILVPKALNLIAITRQRHLFVLAVLIICMGIAWITSLSGMPLALGAFLAGLVVAGSEFRQQALADLIAFREVFTSLFFISIGMLLAPSGVWDNLFAVFILLCAILIGKFLIVLFVGAIMRLPLRVSVLAGAALCQIGEFSFVLMRASSEYSLLNPAFENSLIAASILSMLITPFALTFGPKLAAGVGKLKSLTRLMEVSTAEEASESASLQNHVIIGGYGIAGEELAKALRKYGIPYVITDLGVENVRKAVALGEPACFGDITSPEVLTKLGINRARALVLVINDSSAIEGGIKAARRVAPGVYILVRTGYLRDTKPLLKAGASEVVPAELEAAVEITTRLLTRHKINPADNADHFAAIRRRLEETFAPDE